MGMNTQEQLNAKTLGYIKDNAEVEHAILTPFRWLIGLGKFLICTALLFGWFGFTLFGWVVNVGEYSLENRREAVCDARAYVHICEPFEFNGDHPHADYTWDLQHVIQRDGVINAPDAHPVDDPKTLAFGLATGGDSEERDPKPKPWINLSISSSNAFFLRSNDVFRRKSAQMDEALQYGNFAQRAILNTIAGIKHIDPLQVHLPDAPDLVIRQGVMPADAIGSNAPVTWGMCIKQECAADGSDLNYALFWGDVLWTRPALGEHQQHAVDALKNMDTLAFWLREAHASGIQNDKAIQDAFREYRNNRPNFASGE